MGLLGADGSAEIDFHIQFDKVSPQGSWTMAHELGHNVQWLTGFPHSKYGETTNNFWALYCKEKVSFTILSPNLLTYFMHNILALCTHICIFYLWFSFLPFFYLMVLEFKRII
jgi:hypothetical protein